MLCDDVLESMMKGQLKRAISFFKLDFLPHELRAAHKFNFTPETSTVLEGMLPHINEKEIGVNKKQFQKYLNDNLRTKDFFNLPYSLMWMEISRPHRPERAVSSVDKFRPDMPQINKLGFLVKTFDNSPRKGEIFLFWSFVVKDPQPIGFAMATTLFDFDNEMPAMDAINDVLGRSLTQILNPNLDEQDWESDFFSKHVRTSGGRFYEAVKDLPEGQSALNNAVIDWVGEFNLFYWAVITINAKTGFDKREVTPSSALQKSRRIRNKLPLISYNIVDLNQRYRGALESDGQGGFKKLHWVRGHFKTRKTGIFWWTAHPAGRKELGVVHKRYSV